jgi:hypothetical protein
VDSQLEQFQSWYIPMFQGGVIPTEAKPGSPANAAVAFDGVGERSGGILCFPAAKQHKRFLNSRRKASLVRNDVDPLGYSFSGFELIREVDLRSLRSLGMTLQTIARTSRGLIFL